MESSTFQGVVSSILVLLMLFSKARAELVVKPLDTEVIVGKTVTLNCSSSLIQREIHWYHGKGYVFAGGTLISPYDKRFQIDLNSSLGIYNLVIPSVRPEDAGTYSCHEDEGLGQISSAELIVIENDAIYASNIQPDEVIAQNHCNIAPDEVEFSCSVSYHGNIPPDMVWKRAGRSDDASYMRNTTCLKSSGRIVCSTVMIGHWQMTNSSFECVASRLSTEHQRICTTPAIHTIYVMHDKAVREVPVNDEVICTPKTSLACNYEWKLQNEVISNNRTLKATKPGLHQCNAECHLRDKHCTLSTLVYVTPPHYSNAAEVNQTIFQVLTLLILLLGVALGALCLRLLLKIRRILETTLGKREMLLLKGFPQR